MDPQLQQPENPKKKLSLREFLSLGEVGGYFFRRKDPNRPTNINLRMMHGVNKLSIIIFLLAVIYLIAKRLFL
ncbi:MAG TPA: hypothetical protein PLX35_12075 [Cyclobacteriaceae bacterium]|nr:hypothetical protein [Cyclobacteriaceae bacterium]